MKKNVYDMITDKMVEALEQGIIPWKQSWNGRYNAPMNYASKTGYKGLNPFILQMVKDMKGYKNNLWVTFNQTKKLGYTVNKGESGTPIIFWKFIENKKSDGTKETIPLLRYYTIFNVEQTNIKLKIKEVEKKEIDTIDACEKMVLAYKDMPPISNGSPSYVPSRDIINMPHRNDFNTSEDYYSVLFHEMIHSTGSVKRLNRLKSTNFGSDEYSKEELVAEMGASFLCSLTGIAPKVEKNQTAYIQGWIKKLKGDSKILISCAGKSQKAVEYIKGA